MDYFWRRNSICLDQFPPHAPDADLFKIANRVHNSCLANVHALQYCSTACIHFSSRGRVNKLQTTISSISFCPQYVPLWYRATVIGCCSQLQKCHNFHKRFVNRWLTTLLINLDYFRIMVHATTCHVYGRKKHSVKQNCIFLFHHALLLIMSFIKMYNVLSYEEYICTLYIYIAPKF